MNKLKTMPGSIGKIRPLVKWTGGKYDEYTDFSKYIPKFDRYFEPFVGGGGVFFRLQPKKAFLNDKSSDLITFYNGIKNKTFSNELLKYISIWDNLNISLVDNKEEILNLFKTNPEKIKINMFLKGLDLNLVDEIKKSFISKSKRISVIQTKEDKIFEKNTMLEYIETSFKAGFYTYMRKIINGDIKVNNNEKISAWWIVRELAYASMFRFSKNGNFNIPYGGNSYNTKNLRAKAKGLFTNDIGKTFSSVNFYNTDFEDFLKQFELSENDFIFLDPPYDSSFSEYDNNKFGKDEQIRLRDFLINTKAKWMVVIKETDFIKELYSKISGINILEFDKTYATNMRNRNSDRSVNHLIIMNYHD